MQSGIAGRHGKSPLFTAAKAALSLRMPPCARISAKMRQSRCIQFRFILSSLGFLPGFAYLSGIPPQLQLPRLTTPRNRVPAGSVAIAAHMTAIYPLDGPGGWHLIGATPFVPLGYEAAQRTSPASWSLVRFRRFDAEEAEELARLKTEGLAPQHEEDA